MGRAAQGGSGWEGGKGAGGRAALAFPLSSEGAPAKGKAKDNWRKKNILSCVFPDLMFNYALQVHVRVMKNFRDDEPGVDAVLILPGLIITCSVDL